MTTKDAFYFPHDSNAQTDPKIMLIIEQMGCEGVGIYWMLIEILREQPDYKYPIELIPGLARRWNTTKDKVQVILNNYNLFSIDESYFFYSPSLMRRMQLIDKKRKKLSEAGRYGNAIRWGNKQLSSGGESGGDSNRIASKVKKSKVYNNIIDSFNRITGKNVKLTSSRKAQINARLRENYTLKDFETVIKKKYNEWKDNAEMKQYITPDTLFGTKFTKYLEQEAVTKSNNGIPKSFDTYNDPANPWNR